MAQPTAIRARRRLPEPGDVPGVADARLLPDETFAAAWESIFLPDDMKLRMVRTAVAGVQLRAAVTFESMPLHGVVLLTGKPGVGKTTVARGLADKVARTVEGLGDWAFVEIDPHALASASLGRSQRSVEHLFGSVLSELATSGPLVVLLDEVETLATDRSALSMDANPIDVHRAVDAALVGLDALARRHPNIVVLATSNFPRAIDDALTSRADWMIDVPLPDEAARTAIIDDTLRAVGEAFAPVKKLRVPEVIAEAAKAAEGLDGRAIRKAVAAGCAVDPAAQGNPAKLTRSALLAAMGERTVTL
jgi:SpoVK/Ycf46/Vps4 family AAA+-type ATPase